MKLRIQARAKINWTLDVVGTLPNGYHDLDMLMQSVTLCDQMTIEEAPELSLFVRTHGRAFVPADGNNLVLRAAAALQSATAVCAARISPCASISPSQQAWAAEAAMRRRRWSV